MAVLNAKTRNAIPTSKFALPGERKYPVHDRAHAANAKARATQQYKKGNLSASSRAKIFARANRVLGNSSSSSSKRSKQGLRASPA